jgi:hypothetical protein
MNKRVLAATALALAVAGAGTWAASPGAAQEAPAARIHLLHGLPSVLADVEVGGTVAIDDFAFGDVEDLSAMAGQTLPDLKVKRSDDGQVLIDFGDVTLPSTGNVSLIAHLDASGSPVISVFANDTSGLPPGQGRLVVRHTAEAPPLDVRSGGQVVFANLSSPSEAKTVLPAGTVRADIVPAGQDQPVVLGPADLAVGDGTELIVYAVGSIGGAGLTLITEDITGLGAAPAAIQTGTSPVGAAGGGWVAVLAVASAGATAVALVGLVVVQLAHRNPARATGRRN